MSTNRAEIEYIREHAINGSELERLYPWIGRPTPIEYSMAVAETTVATGFRPSERPSLEGSPVEMVIITGSEWANGTDRDLTRTGTMTSVRADLDGDGLLELVVPAEDGFIHAYDLPGASVAWAGAAYDWARTGFLPPAGARSPESAADLSSEADVAVVDGNPSQEAARDRFRQPVAGPAAAHIYDVSGRQVRVLLDAPQLAAGTHDIEWDGRDTAGEAVPAGVYFTRIRAGHHQMTQRVVKVR